MTAINWSEKPVALIKLGYLSNEEEESKLIDQDYQKESFRDLQMAWMRIMDIKLEDRLYARVYRYK